jgi:hypothetical protein
MYRTTAETEVLCSASQNAGAGVDLVVHGDGDVAHVLAVRAEFGTWRCGEIRSWFYRAPGGGNLLQRG